MPQVDEVIPDEKLLEKSIVIPLFENVSSDESTEHLQPPSDHSKTLMLEQIYKCLKYYIDRVSIEVPNCCQDHDSLDSESFESSESSKEDEKQSMEEIMARRSRSKDRKVQSRPNEKKMEREGCNQGEFIKVGLIEGTINN